MACVLALPTGIVAGLRAMTAPAVAGRPILVGSMCPEAPSHSSAIDGRRSLAAIGGAPLIAGGAA